MGDLAQEPVEELGRAAQRDLDVCTTRSRGRLPTPRVERAITWWRFSKATIFQ
jgi:hypothetical protein